MNCIYARIAERVDLDQPKRSRRVCAGYALASPKAFARPLCTPWDQTTSETKRTIGQRGQLSGLRGHGRRLTCYFWAALGGGQEDTMEGALWRKTFGRSFHDAMEPIGGAYRGDGCRKEATQLHAICSTKTGWTSLAHSRVLHYALARFLS